MDLTAILALSVGLIMVLVAHVVDGGSISVLIQPTAFFIVIGGSFCAALLNFNFSTVKAAFKNAKKIFYHEENKTTKIIHDIIQLSHYARKKGVFALQELVNDIQDDFLARSIQLAIDVNNPQLLYEVLSAEITYQEEEELKSARVFEALGGYAPTFGIVGAVMGLIQVMSNIQDIKLLGAGIATAFVATLYGVGCANLILLPIAGNLKSKTREKVLLKELILQGVHSILIQEHPAIVEEKLVSYLKYNYAKSTN